MNEDKRQNGLIYQVNVTKLHYYCFFKKKINNGESLHSL